jgi:hypothetical protein
MISLDLVKGRVAKHWGLMPWEFRELEREKAAELHAIYQVEQEIEAYYNSEQSKRLDK